MAKEKQQQNNINFSITDEVAAGTYSNIVVLTHSPDDFIIDFGQVMPDREGAVVRQRIIMPPVHAKRFLLALSDNIRKYEDTFGTIVEHHNPDDAIPYDMIPQGKA